MKRFFSFLLGTQCLICTGQSIDNLKLQGDYSSEDSVNITLAYINARQAVERMDIAMSEIWDVESTGGESKKDIRKTRWANNTYFTTWLGTSAKMGKGRRTIRRMNSKFEGSFIMEVTKEDEGRCGRFVSAWAVPYGKVKIRLCRNFVNFGSNNQTKTLIHEIGHEAGLLFDRGVYHCGSAKSVVEKTSNRAKRSPENYAWLAMSYLGVECKSRSRSR